MYGGDKFICVQEETSRGDLITTAPIFLPVETDTLKAAFVEEKNTEYRGDVSIRTQKEITRMAQSWAGDIGGNFYPEGGSSKIGIGLFLKYLMGSVSTLQVGSSPTYLHNFLAVRDPWLTGELGEKGISVHVNRPTVGSTVEAFPFSGGRVSGFHLVQAPSANLKYTADLFGQRAHARDTAIANPTYSTIGRFKGAHCVCWDGVKTTGTGPNYTGFEIDTANAISLRNLNIDITNGLTDQVVIGSEVDYPTETDIGMIQANLSLTAKARDPASGWSSIDTFEKWIDDTDIELFFKWDNTEHIVGTTPYALYVHFPVVHITDSNIDDVLEGENLFTMTGEALVSTDDVYSVGIFLQNSCVTI